jgi:hypothetical protein
MGNPYIDKLVQNQIDRMIAKGQLYTPKMVDKAVNDNLDAWTQMMTIAVNRGLGVGKKRFKEKVQPVLDQVQEDYFQNKVTVDQEYALSVIDRLYDEIMD